MAKPSQRTPDPSKPPTLPVFPMSLRPVTSWSMESNAGPGRARARRGEEGWPCSLSLEEFVQPTGRYVL